MSERASGTGPGRSVVALISGLFLGAGGLALGFALTALVAAVLVAGLGLEPSPALLIVIGLVSTQGVGCAGVALGYSRLRPRIARFFRERLGWTDANDRFAIGAGVPDLRQLGVVVVGYLLALGGAIGGGLLVSLLRVDTGTNQAAEMGMESPEVLLLLVPASILLIGPGEELLFRGVVQGRLREVMGPIGAIGLASVVFAGLHWFALSGGSPAGNLVVLGILVVPSVVFGASYEYTGNIVVPSLIHGIYNATLFSMLYATIRFGGGMDGGGTALLALLG